MAVAVGAAATTWTVAAGAVAATTEAAAIDPAELSARIAGMMMVRLMDMIPPSRLQRSAACYMTPTARAAHLNYLA